MRTAAHLAHRKRAERRDRRSDLVIQWGDNLPQVAVVFVSFFFPFKAAVLGEGNMSHLLSEQWCGIINLPASSLPVPAEARRFSRLPEVVKTRGRVEGGEKGCGEEEMKHIFMWTHGRTKNACNGLSTHAKTQLHTGTDTNKLISFIPSHACTCRHTAA